MKRRFWKKVLVGALVLLLLALAAWRLWPRSFVSLFPGDSTSVTSLSASCTISGIDELHSLAFDTYTVNAVYPGEEDFEAILSLLQSSRYRPDLRNLLPWPQESVVTDDSTRSVTVSLVWDNQEEGFATLFFHTDRLAVLSLATEAGFLRFHPTDRALADQLAEYLQAPGAPPAESQGDTASQVHL